MILFNIAKIAIYPINEHYSEKIKRETPTLPNIETEAISNGKVLLFIILF